VGKIARGAPAEATPAVRTFVAARFSSLSGGPSLNPDTVAAVLIALLLGLEVQTAVGMSLEGAEVIRVLAMLFEDYLPIAAPPDTSRKRSARRSAK
jgi:hypothetical protein